MITPLSFVGANIIAIGSLPLGGWLTVSAARRWAPKLEDPAMYLYVTLYGLVVYLIGRAP